MSVDRRTQPDRRRQTRGPDRRKGGRPRLVDGETSTSVHVRLPQGLHDAICLIALRDGDDLSAMIRLALKCFVSQNLPKR